MIEKLDRTLRQERDSDFTISETVSIGEMQEKINELVDAVNVLKTKVEIVEECIHPTAKVDPYAEQRKWIGCVCRFWFDNPDDTVLDYLGKIQTGENGIEYYGKETYDWFPHCEPVKPDDDIIYQELTPEYLRNLIATSKYWKEQDPEIIRKVEQGFKKLYGDKGE